MPDIHASHAIAWLGDGWMCRDCHVCECHSPETMKEECENA